MLPRYTKKGERTMAEIKLNIYKEGDKNKVEKVHTVDGYDLILGTVEDFMSVIDIDKLDDNMAVAKMVCKSMTKIKPLMKDIFPELTDDEFKRIKVNDLVRTILQVGTSIVENLNTLKAGN
jgi:hypothetical protein